MTSRFALRGGFLAGLTAAVLVLGGGRLGAVEPTFDGKGMSGLRVDGVNVLKQGQPHLRFAVFEQTSPEASGTRKYQFEKVAEPGKASFQADTKTFTEEFSWGTIAVAYKPTTDRLDLIVTVTNKSMKVLADLELGLGAFEFPSEPTGWKGRGPVTTSLDNLAITRVEAGKVGLVVCNATMDPPFALGFGAAEGGKFVYPLLVRGGVYAPEPGAYVIEPHGLPRVPAGKALSLEVTLRRAPAGSKNPEVLADIFEKFRAFHKPALVWDDHRPIGMIIHSSSAKQHQSKTNPRGWLNNPKLDVTTPAGKAAFRTEMLKAAEQGAKIIRDTGGQGMIFWDVEGQENPHPISFIGDPRLASKLAPEMDEIADDYFKVYRDAGLRTGVTLRPSQVYYNETKKTWDHGTGSDGGPGRGDFYPMLRPKDVPWYRFYPVAERLIDKIAYAKKRWGCTLFYVDSNGMYRQVGEDQKFVWSLAEAAVLKHVRDAHPDVLIIPEHARDDYTYHAASWAHSAVYFETNLKTYRTPAAVRDLLPGAFSVVNITEGDLDRNRAEIKAGVAAGDILMFRGWFADKRNEWVKALYEEVKKEKK
jgi:hypothetical protein